MNWMKIRWIYFLISGIALTLSLYSIFSWGLRPSIDFTGGSVVEYKFANFIRVDELNSVISSNSPRNEVKESMSLSDKNVQLRFGPNFAQSDAEALNTLLTTTLGQKTEVVRFETVGPAFSQEILKKTYIAIAIASVGILLWVGWQFKSFKFGVCAVLAMVHDSLILLGTFAILGHYKGVEVDVLFVTALLTVLAFSVHDTIVVYDRVRESSRKFPGISFFDLANKAVSQTMVRSVNNSLTIVFMLFALFLMGGVSIKWFVLALLVGTISGTYSSPFVAVPLLVTWDRLQRRTKR
ncbi:MAG: protein translocase subunit SecF [bacterium]|nr:protein translocase subunit SecF [bacterium]